MTWTVTDAEYARLQEFVSTNGKPGETLEEYALRMGNKSLRSHLAEFHAARQAQNLSIVSSTFAEAPAQTKLAALDTLNLKLVDGVVQPKVPSPPPPPGPIV